MSQIPYGWAADVDFECCIVSPTNAHRMLCGRWVAYAPTVPPQFPHAVHDECRRLWTEGGHKPVEVLDVYGICPDCAGETPLKGGLVGAHAAWRMGRHGLYPSAEACTGEGKAPEPEGER